LPRAYFLGSFVHDSYLAQVVSELFAVAMWWAAVCWSQRASMLFAAIAALMGCATFLTWPVWTAPPLIALMILAAWHRELAVVDRIRHVALALVPIAIIAVVYAIGRTATASTMAGTSGAVLWPSLANLNWFFVGLGAVGTAAAVADPRARGVP